MTFLKRTILALLAASLLVAFHAEVTQAQTPKKNANRIKNLEDRLDEFRDDFRNLNGTLKKLDAALTRIDPAAGKSRKKTTEPVNRNPQKQGGHQEEINCHCVCCCAKTPELPAYKGGADSYKLCCDGSVPTLIVTGHFYECEEVCYEVESDGCYELKLKRCPKHGCCAECDGTLVQKVCKFPVQPVLISDGCCAVCVITGENATWVKLDCQPIYPGESSQ